MTTIVNGKQVIYWQIDEEGNFNIIDNMANIVAENI